MGNVAETTNLTLDAVRILERLKRYGDALAEAGELREALAPVRGAELDYLLVTTSYLRLLRRQGQEHSTEYKAAVADVTRRAEELPAALSPAGADCCASSWPRSATPRPT